ncbi:MAG: isopentenyl-diphosphate Delta-isomerase [Aliivibrio sp.]|uniref:isopentenyl-diphosphate Delta-isomerase n=1 Tax=Aliivibrio sp. TaxID=1872443 RepID=UPI001A5A221D|nr:isopentenyl-diphosphate Delta-isomerase [Aliivibrio sp.]
MNIHDVVLVDVLGQPVGSMEKMAAHQHGGQLHLAFSVMLFRAGTKGREYLLQRRAEGKYHSGGLWTNTCCSHPYIGESIVVAAQRRLAEELGITLENTTQLKVVTSFIYRAELDNDLVEHEFDYVLIGEVTELVLELNPEEVSETRWWSEEEIISQLQFKKTPFTAWFHDVFQAIVTL